jgi:hypothetical protein
MNISSIFSFLINVILYHNIPKIFFYFACFYKIHKGQLPQNSLTTGSIHDYAMANIIDYTLFSYVMGKFMNH